MAINPEPLKIRRIAQVQGRVRPVAWQEVVGKDEFLAGYENVSRLENLPKRDPDFSGDSGPVPRTRADPRDGPRSQLLQGVQGLADRGLPHSFHDLPSAHLKAGREVLIERNPSPVL